MQPCKLKLCYAIAIEQINVDVKNQQIGIVVDIVFRWERLSIYFADHILAQSLQEM